jgi:uracil-DNA glycosylase
VPPGCAVPPSLRNIHAELQRDLGITAPGHGSLRAWAAQGVLLLNTALTVEDGQPAATPSWVGSAHFCDMQICISKTSPSVFMLWGATRSDTGIRPGRPGRHGDPRPAHIRAALQPPLAAGGAAAPGALHRLRPLRPCQPGLQAAGRGAVDWRLQPPA